MTAGFMFPRTATGASSLVPAPPWHYSGQMLTIEYRTDPAAVAELLPAPLEPADDDPGAVAVIWADWQSCSDDGQELLDPVRSQYMETFVVVRCRLVMRAANFAVFVLLARSLSVGEFGFYGYVMSTALVLSIAFDVGLRQSGAWVIGQEQMICPFGTGLSKPGKRISSVLRKHSPPSHWA